jgi:hypothetical protein
MYYDYEEGRRDEEGTRPAAPPPHNKSQLFLMGLEPILSSS